VPSEHRAKQRNQPLAVIAIGHKLSETALSGTAESDDQVERFDGCGVRRQ